MQCVVIVNMPNRTIVAAQASRHRLLWVCSLVMQQFISVFVPAPPALDGGCPSNRSPLSRVPAPGGTNALRGSHDAGGWRPAGLPDHSPAGQPFNPGLEAALSHPPHPISGEVFFGQCSNLSGINSLPGN